MSKNKEKYNFSTRTFEYESAQWAKFERPKRRNFTKKKRDEG